MDITVFYGEPSSLHAQTKSGCFGVIHQTDPFFRPTPPVGLTSMHKQMFEASYVFDFGRDLKAPPFFYQNNFLHHFALLDLFAALFFSGWNLYSHHILSLPAVRLRKARNDTLYTNTFSGSVNMLCSHFIWSTGMSFLFLARSSSRKQIVCVYKTLAGIIPLFHSLRCQRVQAEWLAFSSLCQRDTVYVWVGGGGKRIA